MSKRALSSIDNNNVPSKKLREDNKEELHGENHDDNPQSHDAKDNDPTEIPFNNNIYVLDGRNKHLFDPANLIIGDPKNVRMYTKSDFSYRVNYNNGTSKDISPVRIQTPVMQSTFGFSTYKHDTNDPSARTKLSIDARFNDQDSVALKVFRAIDAHIATELKSRVNTFVAAKKKSPEMIDLMLTNLVRVNEKDGITYAPSVSFKIAASESDGVIAARVKCFTADSTKGSFEEIEVTTFGKGCEYRAVLCFEGIYVTSKSLTPKLRAEQLQKISDGVSDGFAFNDDPTMTAVAASS